MPKEEIQDWMTLLLQKRLDKIRCNDRFAASWNPLDPESANILGLGPLLKLVGTEDPISSARDMGTYMLSKFTALRGVLGRCQPLGNLLH